MNSQSLTLTHKVLEGIEQPYWQWDLVNDEVFYSAPLMKLLGYENKELISDSSLWDTFIDSDTLCDVKSQIEQHIKGEIDSIDVTIFITNKNSQGLWIRAIGKVVEQIEGKSSLMFGTVSDETESRSMIEQLKKQNDSLMLAERLCHSGHWSYDVKTATLDWSPEVFKIHGLNNKSIKPSLKKAENAFTEEDRPTFRSKFLGALRQNQPLYLKSILRQPSGKQVKVEIIGEIEHDQNGEVVSVFGVYKDITEHEEQLRKLKLLSIVSHSIKVPVFFIDENDNVIYQDLASNPPEISSVLFDYINFSITEYLNYKKLAKEQGQFKENNVSFDKYIKVFDLSITYEADEGIFIWIIEDVSEKFRKEQQQVISNRLAVLGNTFGNVSHDINNVLGVALGAIEMLEMKFTRGEKDISSYIERVKNAIDKGKDVTERLLAFTRKPTVKVISFDPIQEIHDNQYLFKQLMLSTINVSFDFEPMNCMIKFPQGEFINILLNLVLNAQDAIQENGLSGKIAISANIVNNEKLEIHVKDSGVGIAEENLAKIFDPFYSSKMHNKGNGIGLANVYSTMYKHNGVIKVEGTSDLGGAHFTLVFRCDVLEEKFTPKVAESALSYSNTKILVLDDEISIAEFVALFVEGKGATVTVANTREELVAVLDSDKTFDIFITDMVLPDLTGKEAVKMVTAKFSEIIVYSISGYIAIEDNSWTYPVLRKPFNSKELAEFLEV